ncbi:MAG TPA: L,D-transpeptidase family protein [Myxococcales bacterium]|jgi:murein L,D-transpeptidase YafK
MNAAAVLAAVLLLGAPPPQSGPGFREDQMKYGRVKKAAANKAKPLKALFAEKKIAWPPAGILLRTFKEDAIFELWAKQKDGSFVLVKEYPVCANSGVVGPKRREGDLQVPEGFYEVNHFNPWSEYHLALGVSYPNASDRILGGGGKEGPLGGQIYIHGKCCTIGCIPIQDDNIEEVYLAALESRASAGDPVRIHIFPTKMTEEAVKRLAKEHQADEARLSFWANLKQGYDFFEKEHRLPRITVDAKGRYQFAAK